jgi:hypothetical protein
MTVTENDPFFDIRPYRNDEVPAVMARLRSNYALADNLAKLRLPRLYGRMPALGRFLIGRWLAWKLRGISTVEQFQALVEPQLQLQIDATAEFSSSGLDGLSSKESYLFISNHRDIAMDPAFTNYALYHGGHRTVAIAIGDNLLREPWVADLMRLNKSFIVKRNISAPRELLSASRHLAQFIRHHIGANQGPVWIAQREGRAKDGIDVTEPAVIKMLSLGQDKKTESLSDALNALKIVPVAIAYELDPCDGAKAAELAGGASYRKADDEDVRSIGMGITGQKGCVHLAFGQAISAAELNVDTVVEAIDQHMVNHYRLFEVNLWAWQILEGSAEVPAVTIHPGTIDRQAFERRVASLPESHQPLLLAMYANPLRRALAKGVRGAT